MKQKWIIIPLAIIVVGIVNAVLEVDLAKYGQNSTFIQQSIFNIGSVNGSLVNGSDASFKTVNLTHIIAVKGNITNLSVVRGNITNLTTEYILADKDKDIIIDLG